MKAEIEKIGEPVVLEKAAGNNGVMVLSRPKIILLDLLLLLAAFLLVNYLRQGSLVLSARYFDLLVLFYACWLPTSLAGKKLQRRAYCSFQSGMRTIFKSNFYLCYTISFVIVFFNLNAFSRLQVFATCLILLILNTGAWIAGHRLAAVEVGNGGEALSAGVFPFTGHARHRISYRLAAADFGLLLVSFWVINFMKRRHPALLPEYDKLLLIIIGLWFVTGLATRKYVMNGAKNIYEIFWQWEKAGLILLAGMAVVVFALRLFHFSRFQGFGTVVLLMALESVLLLMFSGRTERRQAEDVESAEQVSRILDQEPVDTHVDIEAIRQQLMSPSSEQLENRLRSWPNVFAFMDVHIPLKQILWMETVLEQSCEPVDRRMVRMPMRLFVNQQKLNDVRRLNQYFLDLYQGMLAGGYFVGYAHTIRTHYEWVYQKFPRLMAHMVYGVDFLYKRVMPKLPWAKNLYFVITKGKKRIISRAELLGRLSFCGFDIVAEREWDRRFWVIARKAKKPSFVTNPTYGPMVTLNRVGYHGNIIKVYKLRTMHPYSEFLQDYVFKRRGLKKGGKLKDDFRVTSWGKLFRKLWIDELPMLYNWIRGDLKIVGVRPLSSHYLSLYDKELRQLRLQTKPGLIPPFYVDLPETFDEICESEKKYLQAFLKNPIKTDFYYGIVALYNIFVKKARSG